MKNYSKSDYALNRFSKGIVYKFVDEVVEVTQEEYLAQNPDKTESDFLELKAISDEIFFQEDRDDNAKTKKNDSIHKMENHIEAEPALLEEQFIETQEQQYAAQAISELMEEGTLTEVQKRRFVLHIIKGLSLRQVAELEGVTFHAIFQSINAAIKKLKKNKKYFL